MRSVDGLRGLLKELQSVEVPKSIHDAMDQGAWLLRHAVLRNPLSPYTVEDRNSDRTRLVKLDVAIQAIIDARDEMVLATVPTYLAQLKKRMVGYASGLFHLAEWFAITAASFIPGIGIVVRLLKLGDEVMDATEIADKAEAAAERLRKIIRKKALPQSRGPRYRRKMVTRR